VLIESVERSEDRFVQIVQRLVATQRNPSRNASGALQVDLENVLGFRRHYAHLNSSLEAGNGPHHLPATGGEAGCCRSGASRCWTKPLRGRN
jgi:hypothetical protein